jgi:hypothetical protein
MLPTAADLDDPDGFVHREQLDFSELDRMLGEAAGGSGPKPDLRKKDTAEDGEGDDGETRGDDGEGDGAE